MNVLIALNIPRTELKEYADYIGYLFKNENGVYNICDNEEDIMKSNQWFKNFPLKTLVVSEEPVRVGDKFFAKATNQDLNNKVFKYLGKANERPEWKNCTDEIIAIEDESGKVSASTYFLLQDALKFVRIANREDYVEVVKTQSLNVTIN